MHKDFARSVARINDAINTMDFVGVECDLVKSFASRLVSPDQVKCKGYIISVTLASYTCLYVSRYLEDLNQIRIKRTLANRKATRVHNQIYDQRLDDAESKIRDMLACFMLLLEYRIKLVLDLIQDAPVHNRYYR